MTVEKMAVWLPVTGEMLEDAAITKAYLEYAMTGAEHRPLSLRERLTGWRHFTASNGLGLSFRVGWRASLYWATHPIENWRRHHR